MTPREPDGYDRLSARGERIAGAFADRPGRSTTKVIVILIGVCVVLSLVFGLIGWAAGWFNAAKQVTSAQNHSDQSYKVRQQWNAMVNTSVLACHVDTNAKAAGGPVLVEDPATAYEATFNKERADFNRLQQNPFENGIIKVGGYPTHVKIFPQEYKKIIDWCGINKQLVALHP